MPEWLTYSPADLLMFSERTYYRLFELHNRALWPWQIAALLGGAALTWIVWRSRRETLRLAAALLAAAWVAVAWSYLWDRFATIHTAGRAMAVAFGVQAALLIWAALARRRHAPEPGASASRRVGATLVAYAIGIAPLLAPVLGRPWAQAELFALAPDPTVAATLGWLLVTLGAWPLWPIPVAWSVFSGATLWAMRSPEWWVLPASASACVVLAIARRRRSSAKGA